MVDRRNITCTAGGCGKVLHGPNALRMHLNKTHGIYQVSRTDFVSPLRQHSKSHYYIIWSFCLYCSFLVLNSFEIKPFSIFTKLGSKSWYLHAHHNTQKPHIAKTQYSRWAFKKKWLRLIWYCTVRHTLQPSLDRSTVVHPDCAGIVRKQNNFATMALPLNEIFPSFYREQFLEITEYKDSHTMYKMFNNGSNVGTTVICEKGVGRPTQACLILTTSLASIVDYSCKACKLT